MRIKLIVVGKTEETYIEEGIKKYINRLAHYINFELIIIPDIKAGSKMTSEKLKEEEGKLILSKVMSYDTVVLLDEHGAMSTSVEFSQYFQKKMNASVQSLLFIVGGSFGFSKPVYDRANEKIALSKMTFSHQMVRLFFVEQLYRAFTILKGEKYHHT